MKEVPLVLVGVDAVVDAGGGEGLRHLVDEGGVAGLVRGPSALNVEPGVQK